MIQKSIVIARKITRFFLAAFIWSHALFVLNTQSTILGYVKNRIQLTTAEAILLILLLIFSFVAGGGFLQAFGNLLYIYFFPFVLLFYTFYWPLRILRFSLLKIKMARSADVPPGQLTLQVSPSTLILTAPISQNKVETENKIRAVLEFLSRPFRKFTYLWCLLVLLATHKPILWIALTVLILQMLTKIYWLVCLVWSSRSFLDKVASHLSKFLNDTINKLTELNFEAAPVMELKNLLNQIKGFKIVLGFVTNSVSFSRLTLGTGLALLICAHLYFALIFSCVYVGGARAAGFTLDWANSFTISVFILAYITELPKVLLLRILGGLHFSLVLTLGAGTIVSYFRKQLEPLRSTLTSVHMRLSEGSMQEKFIILQSKVEAAETTAKSTKGRESPNP